MSKELSNQSHSGLVDMVKLLSPQDQKSCQVIADGEKPWSQRAQALLAIDQGASVEAASERSGLRTTQVEYWVNKFQKAGMDIFPGIQLPEVEDTLPSAGETALRTESQTPAPTSGSGESVQSKAKNKKKQKGKNKNTKSKKGKKGKRKKKSAKGKGSSKKSKKKQKK